MVLENLVCGFCLDREKDSNFADCKRGCGENVDLVKAVDLIEREKRKNIFFSAPGGSAFSSISVEG